MNMLKKITLAFLLCIFSFNLIACEKNNKLDVSVYCKEDIAYDLNGTSSVEGKFKLDRIINGTSDSLKYSKIQISTKKDWTYGLEIDRIEFDILLSTPADVDIDVTVSNLENGPHFNEDQNTYYYQKTLSINKQNTTIKLDIDDVFNSKSSIISIEINKACYSSHPDLTIAIGNFKMFGQHNEVNY